MEKRYVIRFKDRKESAPLTDSEMRKLISKGEIKADDNVSVYPDQFALSISSYPEFEELFTDHDKTSMMDLSFKSGAIHEDKTGIHSVTGMIQKSEPEPIRPTPIEAPDVHDSIKNEKTGLLEVPEGIRKNKDQKKSGILPKMSVLLMVLFLLLYMQQEEEEDEETASRKGKTVVMQPIRPKLPSSEGLKADPITSGKAYQLGIKPYYQDTVAGYRKAAAFFHESLKYDGQNVNALAMLASCYLNMMESSNQDENTFAVISKLIDLSKVKDAVTVETLIAELEFLIASRRYDSAMQKLTEYAKITSNLDARIFYYLGLVLHLKGDNAGAIQNLNMIPVNNFPVPKLFHLLGRLYEQNGQLDEAAAEFKRALKYNKQHAKSLLGLIRVFEKRGNLKSKSAVTMVEFLYASPSLQTPSEFIETLHLRSKIALLFKKQEVAIKSLAEAIQINPKNEELKLEFYALASQASKSKKFGNLAKMYSLVLEGEGFAKEGKTHEAIVMFIKAKDEYPKSSIPTEKMGDLFYRMGEYTKSLKNYKDALKINPKDKTVVVKMVDSAIKSQDFEEAQKTLAKYKTDPKMKSSIDRLAGDLAAKQGFDRQAIEFYLKAMKRDTIDTDVYSAYAEILRKNERYKDAQFFYSIAQKYDPQSRDAILGAAKCLLKTDGLKNAVSRIQDELSRSPKVRADLLSAIAEIYLMGNNQELALNFAEQAIEADADYPESYRIKSMVYLEKMNSMQKDAKKNALQTLKEYAERKPVDTFGYLKRFEIFIKDSDFEKATEELNRIFEISPRFPELHYKRAVMYVRMGKIKDSLMELDEELKISPKSIKALDERGNVLVKMNQLDEAMKSYTRSMELEPRNPDSKLGAGYVSYLKRQFNSAIALYQSALSLDKGNPEIHKRLGQAYRDSGDQAKAAQYFRNYLDLAPDAPDRADYDKYR
jgi:tetratricopeptide (TPR) repeat protein